MKRFTIGLAASLALLFGAVTGTAVVQADTVESTQTTVTVKADGTTLVNGVELAAGAHTPWTGKHFRSQYVCVQNNIGTFWSIDLADNYFESGLNTLVINDRFPAWGDQPCSTSYEARQRVMVGTISADPSTCFEVYLPPADAYGHYTDQVTIGMNAAAYEQCDGTAQHRNFNISNALGNSFGLASFTSSGWQASIMNQNGEDLYNFAGADDRTSLCQRMDICS